MQIDTTQLASIQNISLQEFVAVYNMGGNVAAAYYTELSLQGASIGNSNISNYANLARDVTTNSGVSGRIGNAYSQAVASDLSVDFSVGSANWLEMQYSLMRNDFLRRQTAVSLGAEGELNYQATDEIHTQALSAVGLPPQTYSLHAPLNQLGQQSPFLAQEVFQDVLVDSGFGDNPFTEGLAINVVNDWSSPVSPEYWDWVGNIIEVLVDDPSLLGDAVAQEFNDFLDLMNQLGQDISNWIDNLFDGDGDGDGRNDPPPNEQPNTPQSPNREGNQGSPLVLDLDGDGVELYALGEYGSYFDLRGNGQAVLTGWVEPDDGILALDVNGNGKIDDISELFGNEDTDGFTQLAEYDSNADGNIDASDLVYSNLLIWTDLNSDGISQAAELHTLADFDIDSISLNAMRLAKVEIAGNEITHKTTYKLGDGAEFSIVDAWFKYDVQHAINVENYDMDIRTAFLPTLKGFGNLKDLHISVSTDNDETNSSSLMSQLIALVGQDLTAVLSDWEAYKASVETLLLRWARVEEIAPASRGAFVDARHLAFNEAFYGEPFSQYGQPDPLPEAGDYAEAVFDYHVDFHAAQILTQIAGDEIFAESSYNPWNGTTKGNLALLQSGIDEVEAAAIAATDGTQVWIEYSQLLAYAKGLSNLTPSEVIALDAAVAATGEPGISDWQDVVNEMTAKLGAPIDSSDDWGSFEITYDNYNPGSSSDDLLIDDNAGGFTDNEFNGFGGNDLIQALDGHDKLIGGTGNDTLEGGLGDDYSLGGAGNDIYVYESGNDTFSEVDGDGIDEIHVLAVTGLTEANVADLYRFNDDLLILLDNGSFLTIDTYGASNAEIEKIVFQADSSEINLAGIVKQKYYGTNRADRMDLSGENFQTLEAYGYDGNDLIEATGAAAEFYGGDGYDTLIGDFQNDVLDGGANDDALIGADGDDMLDGGDGNDLLDGGAGDDIIHSGEGKDTIVYGRGYGDDYVSTESKHNDRIDFASSILTQDLILERGTSLDDLVIRVSDTSETLTLEDNFRYIGSQWWFAPTEFRFTDGTIWSDQFIRDKMIFDSITTADDLTRGYADDNLFASSPGNDEIFGYQGGDHYFWGSGSGNDRITEMLSGNDLNQLTLEGLNVGDVTVDREVSADNLILINNTTLETLTVIDQFRGSYYEVDQFNLGDANWTARDLEVQLILDNTTLGDDVTHGFIGDDMFASSPGNDEIFGYQGGDHYFWGPGSGNDRITEMLSGNDLNQLTLEGLNVGDVTVDRDVSADNLILINNTTLETLTVIDQFRGSSFEIDQFNFADATWTARDIEIQYIANNTTPGDDITYGFRGDDIFLGSTGDDQQFGDSGNDFMDGGAGNDLIDGESGNDVLVGGSGTDDIEGGNNDDILFGDAVLSGDFNGNGNVSGLDFLEWQRRLGATGFNIDGDANWDGIVDGSDLEYWAENHGTSVLGTPAANDTLDGQNGDDILFAGDGFDTLIGGSGADSFIFERNQSTNGLATILDFDSDEGDSLNLVDLIFESYDPTSEMLSDFVLIAEDGSGTKLSIDPDGGGNFMELVDLSGVTELINDSIATEAELQSLVANGVIIVDVA